MKFFDRDKVVLQKVQEAYQKGFEDRRGNQAPASPVPIYGTPANNEGASRGYDEGHADAQKGADKKGGAFEGGYKLGHRKGVQEGYKKGYDAGKQKGLADEYLEACQGIAPEFVARIIREWREYEERLQELGEIEVTVVMADPASRPEDDPDWPKYVTWLKKGGRTGASEMNQEERPSAKSAMTSWNSSKTLQGQTPTSRRGSTSGASLSQMPRSMGAAAATPRGVWPPGSPKQTRGFARSTST